MLRFHSFSGFWTLTRTPSTLHLQNDICTSIATHTFDEKAVCIFENLYVLFDGKHGSTTILIYGTSLQYEMQTADKPVVDICEVLFSQHYWSFQRS